MTIRSILWWLSLIIASSLCWRVAQVSSLQSDPELRVLLYFGIFLSHIGLIFLWPFQKKEALWIFGVAVLLRVLLFPAPVSDDVHRYLWEGKLVTQGINPYTDIADSDVFIPQRDEQWEKMNHKERLTAYPPGIQLIFGATSAISYTLPAFKVLFVLADLLTLLFLICLLKARAQPVRYAGFYAFSPIVLHAIAAEAHYDSFFILGLVSFFLAAELKKPWLAWLSLAFAFHIKIVSIILAPLYFDKKTWKSSWLFPLGIVLPAIPFFGNIEQLWKGLFGFATGGQFNGFFHAILMHLSSPDIANVVVTILFAILGLSVWISRLRGLPLVQACFWAIAGLLFFSPVVHFWYLLWVIPLFAIRPSLSLLVLSGTMGLYFMVWSRQPWGLTPVEHIAIWLPFACIALLELPRALRRIWNSTPYSRPQTVSVVIPTLNAETALPKALASVHGADEIVISDGGSTDKTLETAAQENIPHVISPPGRGAQIANGINATTGDLIIVLHADATLPDHAIARALEYFQTHQNAAHAVLGQRFDHAGPLGIIVEVLNEMRVVLNGTTFGDQVQIFHRAALEKAGHFPTQPLMEDVEAALRTLPLSMTGYLGHECTVSGEKWRTGRSHKRFALVVQLVATYRIARWQSKEKAAQLTERLYKKYYG